MGGSPPHILCPAVLGSCSTRCDAINPGLLFTSFYNIPVLVEKRASSNRRDCPAPFRGYGAIAWLLHKFQVLRQAGHLTSYASRDRADDIPMRIELDPHALNPEGLDLQFKPIQRSLKSGNLCCISFTNCHLGKASRFGAPIPALLKQNVLLQFGDAYDENANILAHAH